MGKHLVLIGGGHAHMVTLANLHEIVTKGHRVTVIGPSEHHYYSGMGPGMLSRTYTPGQIRFATRHVVEKQGGEFILDKVARVDPEARQIYTEKGQTVPYDVLSFNAGSYVPADVIENGDKEIYSAKPIERLLAAQKRLMELGAEKKVTVGVVGGGAAAVELAGNARHLLSETARHGFEVSLFTRGKVLERFPEKVQNAGRRALRRIGIHAHEERPIQEVSTGKIQLVSGETHSVDLIFLAVGVKPSPIFAASNLPTGPDGGLRVNGFLQSTAHPEIFGGGDCIFFENRPLEKVGVYAVRENPVLYQNLIASLDGGSLTTFDPGGPYLLIFNLGGGYGLFFKKGVLLKGKPAFWIKDYIDRRFMRKFQAIE